MPSVKDLIDIALLVIIYLLFFYKKWKVRGRDVLFINTMMYIYLSFVMYFTLMPIITSLPYMFSHSYVSMNMEPFIDFTMNRGDALRQIVLNIIMTIPFGFLLPFVGKGKTGLLKVVLLTFILSLSIEMIQPLLSDSRRSDITDLITNVFGGVIGYGMYLVFRPVVIKFLGYLRISKDG